MSSARTGTGGEAEQGWPGWIVWNAEEGRARAAWRILVPLVPTAVVGGAVGALLFGRVPIPVVILGVQLALALAAVVAVAVTSRYLDRRRSVRDYGFQLGPPWFRDLGAGFAVGLLAVSLPYVVGIVLGGYQAELVLHSGALGLGLGMAVMVVAYLGTGVWEELVYRGVLISNLADWLRKGLPPRTAVLWAFLLHALIFGFAHVQQWTEQAAHPALVVTWIGSGLVYGLLYLLSGSLALPIGVHAANNAAAAVLFSETAPEEVEAMPLVVHVEALGDGILWGHGGVMMMAHALMAGGLGVVWLLHSRGRPLSLWREPAVAMVDEEPAAGAGRAHSDGLG